LSSLPLPKKLRANARQIQGKFKIKRDKSVRFSPITFDSNFASDKTRAAAISRSLLASLSADVNGKTRRAGEEREDGVE